MASIPRAADDNAIQLIKGSAWNKMGDQANRSANISVTPPLSINTSASGICISLDSGIPRDRIEAWITNSTRDGSNWRWFYDWEEIRKTSAGYGSNWAALPSGRSGSHSNNTPAYNRLEDINTTTGMTGIGVSLDNIPNGFSLQPIPNHTPVMIDVVILSDGTTEYWFSVSNGIDGTCG